MMKLDKFQREMRKEMLDNLKAKGGEVFSFPEDGLTVVVAPAVGGTLAEFAHVAVAQCDLKDDEFKRKVGEFVALERWEGGQVLAVPFVYRDNDEMAQAVRELILAY